MADVGAYLYDADGNHGWTLAEEFKTFPSGEGGSGSGQRGSASGGMASRAGGAGASPSSSTGGGGETNEADEGCGCELAGQSQDHRGGIWGLAMLATLLTRRRSQGKGVGARSSHPVLATRAVQPPDLRSWAWHVGQAFLWPTERATHHD